MMIFDASSRDNCEVKRQDTSTPLQSLTLMNNPEFIEAANFLSKSIENKSLNINDKIIYLYRTVTGRTPNNNEISKLKNYLKDQIELDNVNAFNKLTMLVYNLDETSQKS